MALWVVAFANVLRLTAQLILIGLNIAEVQRHPATVPVRFNGVMDDAAFRRSVAYTLAKSRFGMIADVWEAGVLAAVVFSGLLPATWEAWHRLTGTDAAWSGALFFIGAVVGLSLPGLPFAWWARFRLEERFGVNRSTPRLWIYGGRLRGLYLYGSYARGDARAGSDVDVLVVLDEVDSYSREIQRTSEPRAEVACDMT